MYFLPGPEEERPEVIWLALRKTGAGSNKCKFASAFASAACRTTARSSRIQNDLPCVATASSFPLIFMSCTATTGKLLCNGCQAPPSSKEI